MNDTLVFEGVRAKAPEVIRISSNPAFKGGAIGCPATEGFSPDIKKELDY